MPDQTLDARMFNCPEPILRTRKALAALTAGQTIRVLATDPGAVLDFQAYCRISGHELIGMEESDGEYRFLIRKA